MITKDKISNKNTPFSFNDANIALAKKEIAKYPKERKASAVLALLRMAQEQNKETNCITPSAIAYVSKMLEMPHIRVAEVSHFYSQFRNTPTGKYHLQVCGTVPCFLCQAGSIKDTIMKHLQIVEGETTQDGLFTLSEVECLGACINAPILQVNDEYFEKVTPEFVSNLINELKEGKPLKTGFTL